MEERRFAHGVTRGIEHDEQFHEFRWLQIDDEQRQPASAAVDRLADAWNEHRNQQRSAGNEQIRREPLPKLHGNLERHKCACQASSHEHGMPRQEIPRAIPGMRGSFGHSDRGGVHHHQPDSEQQ